ncbi:hypothetical protein [Nostoc sp. MS1]|uniref:WD40 domain-containing protein n=1 Tax=Nostoc sp. MS1 TaxID=2764711 RepID=UPI001CC3AA48|nr:hypothetical protein [Nostoc sp. MS1]BCL36579.1 hypothetical protein NSMS1_30260 [Nostoc sp. MS1]
MRTDNNDNSLEELNWAIATSQGEFSLILALCNARTVRNQLVESLKASSSPEIREIVLAKSVTTLYKTLQDAVGNEHPQALMVSGLESVNNLEQVLTTANQVREEFRRNFHFPLVLWVTDEVLQKLMRLAPDIHSWSTTVEFAIASNDLTDFIEQTADEVFEKVLAAGAGRFLDATALNLQVGSPRRMELESARNELQNRRLNLSPELEASLEFLLGRVTSSPMERSRQHYERSLQLLGQVSPTPQILERRACLLYCLGLWWLTYAALNHREQQPAQIQAKEYFQQCVTGFESANRQDLVAKFINALGVVLQALQEWTELETVATKALALHQAYPHTFKVARAYGFLAEVAISKLQWNEAKEKAEQAIKLLDSAQVDTTVPVSAEMEADLDWENSYHRGWYLFALGRSQSTLNQPQAALQTLETASTQTKHQYDPELYISILGKLRDLYFQQGEYLKAFNIRQEQRSLEQQYGFRAFIGAGRLQPQQIVNNPALLLVEKQDIVAQEIAASGRQQDIIRLIERMGQPDRKLTIIHGQSGVGKSSILQAGLVPALKQRSIGVRDVLPVLLQVYPDWVQDLGKALKNSILQVKHFLPAEADINPTLDSTNAIITQLTKHDDYNLLTVLIFDQFEEFFFIYKDPTSRRPFYEFLRECLDTPFVKVILSLREDYLHYLLECNNRLADFEVINNNILDKDILYYLGNFSPKDTKSIIQILTTKTQVFLEATLVDELVRDLARDLGEVRPIELQVVGAQLQTDKIIKLEQYQENGPKEKFVGRFLAEIVKDCGAENEQIAKLVLYLLTDENNTRPLKTRADLELELDVTDEKLDLVLEILVKSGLVLRVPASPADRYQLVHDYLVPFVRQQQSARLIAELEKEREQRKLTEAKLNAVLQEQLLEARRGLLWKVSSATIIGALAIFLPFILINQNNAQLQAMSAKAKRSLTSNRDLEALVESLRAGKRLQQWWSVGVSPETEMQVKTALQDTAYTIREINSLEGHVDSVTSVSFSYDGQKVVSGSADGTVIIWSVNGEQLDKFKPYDKKITNLRFTPDNKKVIVSSEDKILKLLNLKSKKTTSFQSSEGEITTFTISSNGEQVISGDTNGKITFWDLNGIKIKRLPQGHNKSIKSLSISRDGQLIVSSSTDNTVNLWNINGEKIKTWTEDIIKAEFSFDNKIIILLGSSYLKLVRLDGSLIRSLSSTNGYFQLYPDNLTLTSVSFNSSDIYIETSELNTNNKYGFSLLGHKNTVNSVSVSPDGKMLVSGSDDKTVKLWNLENKPFEITDEARLDEVVFGPNNKLIALNNNKNKVQIWQPDKNIKTLIPGNNSKINFSSDSQKLVSASQESVVQIWQQDGKFIKTIEGEVVDGSFSRDGRTIALIKGDNTVALYSSNGQLIKLLKRHKYKINEIYFSADGETLITVSQESTNIWKRDGTLIGTINAPIRNIGLRKNGENLVTLDNNNIIKFLKPNGKLIKSLSSDDLMELSVSPDGEIVIIQNRVKDNDKKQIEIWRMDGKLITKLSAPNKEQSISDAQFILNQKVIVTISNDRKILLWSYNGNLLSSFDFKNFVSNIYMYVFSANYKNLAVWERANQIKIFKNDGTVIKAINLKTKEINYGTNINTDINFSPDGKALAVRTNTDTIEIWGIDGTFITTITGFSNDRIERFVRENENYNDYYIPFLFSLDRQNIAIRTGDNTVKLWRLKKYGPAKDVTLKNIDYGINVISNMFYIPNTDKLAISGIKDNVKMWQLPKTSNQAVQELQILRGHKNIIADVAINPKANIVASASYDDKTVKLWGRNGTVIYNFFGHKKKVNSVSFNPNGDLIASASDDKTVKVWKLDGTVMKSFEEHGNGVTSVIFSPNGKLIASASKDNTVKIWSLNNQEVVTLNNEEPVTNISFSPDSKIIASADSKTVKLWSLDGTLLTIYERFGAGDVSFSPVDQTIAAAGQKISLWDFDLQTLLKRGCNAARDYLQNNPKVDDRDRHLCDDVK